jgi:hypothetical protein
MRALALVALFVVAGCTSDPVPEIPIPHDRSLVIVPFATPGEAAWSSALGYEVALRTEKRLDKVAAFAVLEAPIQLLKDGDPAALKASELGVKVKADYVLEAAIETWDPRGKTIGLARASSTVAVTVTSVQARKVVARRDVKVQYPDEGEILDKDDDLEDGLKDATAKAIAELFAPTP